MVNRKGHLQMNWSDSIEQANRAAGYAASARRKGMTPVAARPAPTQAQGLRERGRRARPRRDRRACPGLRGRRQRRCPSRFSRRPPFLGRGVPRAGSGRQAGSGLGNTRGGAAPRRGHDRRRGHVGSCLRTGPRPVWVRFGMAPPPALGPNYRNRYAGSPERATSRQ
jgi:hypothetical protein